MIKEYIAINRILRIIKKRILDAIESKIFDDDGYVSATIESYIKLDLRDLDRLWPTNLEREELIKLIEHINNLDQNAYYKLYDEYIPKIEDIIDNYYSQQPMGNIFINIADYLHPTIITSSYSHFKNHHYREAVFNAITAVFDLIRKKTNVDKDGAALISEVLSIERPKLILSTLKSESGKNDQKGFLQILQGAFLGIRNPKAHTLESDLNELKCAQYLIFASLLARRIDEAEIVKNTRE